MSEGVSLTLTEMYLDHCEMSVTVYCHILSCEACVLVALT